jgi:hypothetical protein
MQINVQCRVSTELRLRDGSSTAACRRNESEKFVSRSISRYLLARRNPTSASLVIIEEDASLSELLF